LKKQNIFKRFEKKYLLTKNQYERLLEKLQGKILEDSYPHYSIYSLYFDNDSFSSVRKSIEKPKYKEKLRLRSYGLPNQDKELFLELKKKYQGVVYKRRISLSYQEAEDYLFRKIHPKEESQIFREIDYSRKKEGLEPKVMIRYDRDAYMGKEDSEFRITFDRNILGYALQGSLDREEEGFKLLQNGEVLMEVKSSGVLPLWFSQILSEESIFMGNFSKYGNYYKSVIFPNLRFGMEEKQKEIYTVRFSDSEIWKKQPLAQKALGRMEAVC